MVLPQIILPGGMQVQDTSCVRPEDQDGGDNNMGSIKTSQELRMLSRSPSDCRSPLLNLNLNLNRCLFSDCSDFSAIVVLL